MKGAIILGLTAYGNKLVAALAHYRYSVNTIFDVTNGPVATALFCRRSFLNSLGSFFHHTAILV